ncbi:MAG TPA: NAD(P)-binding protein, partial [Magnetospirillaceae bacterium]|nr:NAD(P)-binding protein [Magnetospirillaceae bacterium]
MPSRVMTSFEFVSTLLEPRKENASGMEEDKVIIIGAGIAGLAAGIYARLNGYDAEVFEAHGAPGGLCTGWRREGYTFDGCIQWIPGASPASPFHRYWTELGVLPSISIDAYHEILHCEREDGKSVVLHGDADRLEQNLASLSPEDS